MRLKCENASDPRGSNSSRYRSSERQRYHYSAGTCVIGICTPAASESDINAVYICHFLPIKSQNSLPTTQASCQRVYFNAYIICRGGIVGTAPVGKRHAECPKEEMNVEAPSLIIARTSMMYAMIRNHPPPAGLTAGEWRSSLSGCLIRSFSSPIIRSTISRRSL